MLVAMHVSMRAIFLTRHELFPRECPVYYGIALAHTAMSSSEYLDTIHVGLED
jgi:hypothetical protein